MVGDHRHALVRRRRQHGRPPQDPRGRQRGHRAVGALRRLRERPPDRRGDPRGGRGEERHHHSDRQAARLRAVARGWARVRALPSAPARRLRDARLPGCQPEPGPGPGAAPARG
ncbi:hypothetical protein DR950_33475 [Kitasatospora xanthocidica]|uniref:Uncharacterized protein n=1 Tax=Kitasatospora xanthocidica TaxID=83382 RepID=A0A373A1H1_9ACTN|nr:hypothetical protein DR950_33475 [Kitasatospora xanthocidica]